MATEIKIWQGDITKLEVDAVVNAANSALMGGGGVDGAIHRAGGPVILEECRAWKNRNGSLPPGNAMATSGGKMPAKKVIHTVGPIWGDGKHNEDELLKSCYRACLDVAEVLQLRTIAFPAISTGVYGFPRERAAHLAVAEVQDWLEDHPGLIDTLTFCCFDEPTAGLYRKELNL